MRVPQSPGRSVSCAGIPRGLACSAMAAATAAIALLSCDKGPVSYPLEHCPVVINEFMTSNSTTTIIDEGKDPEDWIEVYNASDTPFDLSLLRLSDDSTDRGAYAFPDTFIAAHGYYLVWADDDPGQGRNHAEFKLSSDDGDELILSGADGRIVDRIQFFPSSGNPEARLQNVSYGRRSDGAAEWTRQLRPTPEGPNSGP